MLYRSGLSKVFALIRRAPLDLEFANPTWSFECGQRRNQEIDLCLRDVGTGICAPGFVFACVCFAKHSLYARLSPFFSVKPGRTIGSETSSFDLEHKVTFVCSKKKWRLCQSIRGCDNTATALLVKLWIQIVEESSVLYSLLTIVSTAYKDMTRFFGFECCFTLARNRK